MHRFFKALITIAVTFFVVAIFVFIHKNAEAAVSYVAAGTSVTVSSGNMASVGIPSGIANNDILVVVVHSRDNVTSTMPAGWTLKVSGNGNTTNRLSIFWKRTTGTESAPTVTHSGGNAAIARMYAFRGAATSGDPFDVAGSVQSNSGSPISTAAITTTVSGDMILHAFGSQDRNNWGSLSGTPTTDTGAITNNNSGSNDDSLDLGYGTQASAGSTGAAGASQTQFDPDAGVSVQLALKPTAITTLGNGTDPSNVSLAPGASATMSDAFTFATNYGTDSITAVVVGLASGTSGGLSLIEITDDSGSTVYGSVSDPSGDTPSISLSGLTVTSSQTQFKIRITPKSHANMPVPPGSSYSVTAKINSWTGTNTQAGSDTAGTTVTVDNLSPGATTGASASAGDTQISVSWTNPADADFSNVVVMRDSASISSGSTAQEGSSPTVGSSCGGTACQVRYISGGTSFTDTGLSNGTTYYYRIFAKDSNGNYTAYSSTQEVSGTPSPAPVTTLGSGTDPSAATIAPGDSETDVDNFTLQTNTGTESISSVTVDLSTNSGIARLSITDNSNTELGFTTSPSAESNVISVSGLTANTSLTTYKVRVTPLSHAAMPAVPGGVYDITAPVTAWAGSNTHTGSDANTNALTIDNASPANATSVTGSAGNAQVTIDWTEPTDTDYHSMVVLRRSGSAVADNPTEGTTYIAGNTIGTATVACVVAASTESCNDTGLSNGSAYHYKIFSKDSNGNYSSGVVPTGSPLTPSATTFTITSSAGSNGSISPLGAITVAQGSSQTFNITPDSGYDIATLTVDGSSIATSTSYTFTNVQANHSISATFSASAGVTFTITATSGSNGSVTPSGVTTVNQGDSQTYTITPDSGYETASLTVDGSSVAVASSYTFTNVQANHTISATFSLSSTGVTEPTNFGGSIPAVEIRFAGMAFPGGKISVLDKDVKTNYMISKDYTVKSDGSFLISFVSSTQQLHSFALAANDADNRTSQTKFFSIDISLNKYVLKNFILPPTIDVIYGQTKGIASAKVFGYSSPSYSVSLYVDGIIKKEVLADKNGLYSFDMPTGELEVGQHSFAVKSKDPQNEKESDFSISKTFSVSGLAVSKADLNGDSKIDITDWSIFIARWGSKSSLSRMSIDMNNDGKIDISDFSIFIKTVKK